MAVPGCIKVHGAKDRARGRQGTGGVGRDVSELHHLGHDALPAEGCVAVQQDGHDAFVAGVLGAADEVLLGARLADDDGVDCLEVRRVGGQVHVDLAAFEVAHGMCAQVVLDIGHGEVALGELVADCAQRLAEEVHQHVEPPAVCHPDFDAFHAQARRRTDHGVEAREDGLSPLDAKALDGGELAAQEPLQVVAPHQYLQGLHRLRHRGHLRRAIRLASMPPSGRPGVRGALAAGAPLERSMQAPLPLKNGLDPAALEAVREMCVLDCNAPTITFSHELHHFHHCPLLFLLHKDLRAEVVMPLEVDLVQPENREVHEARIVLEQAAHVHGICVDPVDGLVRAELFVRTSAEGIQIRREVPAVPAE